MKSSDAATVSCSSVDSDMLRVRANANRIRTSDGPGPLGNDVYAKQDDTGRSTERADSSGCNSHLQGLDEAEYFERVSKLGNKHRVRRYRKHLYKSLRESRVMPKKMSLKELIAQDKELKARQRCADLMKEQMLAQANRWGSWVLK
jgi:hypothetical protein